MQHSTDDAFKVLQQALWDYGSLEELAEKTGLHFTTLYKYRAAGVKHPWPRATTWQKLLPELGLKLKLVKDEE